MIVEYKRDTYAGNFDAFPFYDNVYNGILQPELGEETFALYKRHIQNNIQFCERQKHQQLQADLSEYM